MATREARERRERIRNNMRQFYNLSAENRPQIGDDGDGHKGPVGPASGGASAAPQRGIDAPDFNVTAYTADLLQHTTIKGLYDKDTTLRREIRELDGSLQELVYQNYSKFINATDTIRSMRDNVADMDDKLLALSANVEDITAVSKSIGQNLEAHRTRIEEMLLRNSVLQRMKFLVELPSSLRKAVAAGRFSDAVRDWRRGDAALLRHANIAALHRTHDECREIARGIYKTLSAIVTNGGMPNTGGDDDAKGSSEAMDTEQSTALVRLAVADMTALLPTSIFTPAARPPASDIMLLMTDRAQAGLERRASQAIDFLVSEVREAATFTDRSVQPPVPIGFERIPKRLEHANVEEGFARLKMAFSEFAVQVESAFSAVPAASSAEDLRLRVMASAQPQIMRVIDAVFPAVKQTAGTITRYVIANHSRVTDSNRSAADAALVVLRVAEEAFEAVTSVLRRIAKSIKQLAGRYLTAAGHEQAAPVAALVDEACQSVLRYVLATIDGYADRCPELAPSAASASRKPSDDRFMACFNVLVAALMAKLYVSFQLDQPGPHTAKPAAGGASSSGPTAAELSTLAALRGSFAETTRRLIAFFVSLIGQHAERLFTETGPYGDSSGTSRDTPSAPHAAMQQLTSQLTAVHSATHRWFPDGAGDLDVGIAQHRRTDSAVSNSSSQGGGGPSPSSPSHIPNAASLQPPQRPPSQRPARITPKIIDAVHIQQAVLERTALFVRDMARGTCFSPAGFQQFQIDLSLLLQTIAVNGPYWLQSEVLVVSAINEAAVAALSRVDGAVQPLSNNIVEKLARSDV